jgi:hypothetical protein
MSMAETAKCGICGEPMLPGEEVFKFHGYSGPCPKPPLLKPHQQRVVAEKDDLCKKAKALSDFIGLDETFDTLDPMEQGRLRVQNDLMWQYVEVLMERIAAFK